MRTYKKIDFWISCLLIAVFMVIACIRRDETFFIGYFTVGAWHVISMIVHAINNWFTEKGGTRFYYHWLVLSIFVLTGIGFLVTEILVMILYIMLFAAPVMAVYYTVLCYNEVYVKMRRPIELLK